jgi:hypothetical protein
LSKHVTKPTGVRWGRIALLIGLIAVLYFAGQLIVDGIVDQLSLHLRAHNEPMLHRAIMTAAVIYVAFMTIPFMPAAEIGFSMLLIFGGKIAFLVYVSTVAPLTLAYLIGRLLPAELGTRAFGALGLIRAHEFTSHLAQLRGEERMEYLIRQAPIRLVPFLLRHRYLTLAVLLNLPGNIIVGGGGGIAMLAGMTRLFAFPAYLLTVVLAVAPVPLVIYLMA